MSCCSCCIADAPRAIAVVLDGYTGIAYQDLNNTTSGAEPIQQNTLHPSWTQFGSTAPPYILYYSGGSAGGCSYSLLNGPGLVKDDSFDTTNPCTNIHSYRPTLTATLSLVAGVPTVTVNVPNCSTFTGAVAAAAPIDCTATNDVTLPLVANSCGPLSDGANATCRVWLLGPPRDCVTVSPPCDVPVDNGTPPPVNRFSPLRQPGFSRKCFSPQQCDCCVCNLDGRPPSFKLTFSNWTTGQCDSNCSPFNTGFYILPWVFNDPNGNCYYGYQSSIFSYYLLLEIGFDGDPSDRGVFARLYMLKDPPTGQPPAGTYVDFLFELDHIEYCWLENQKQIPWRGKGTFPCLMLDLDLPLQIDNGEAGDGPFCDEDDIRSPIAHISAQGGTTEPGGCCCPGQDQHGPGKQNTFVCFSSDDPNCPLSGLLVQLEKNGTTWSGTAALNNGGTINVTASYGNGGWTVSWNCGGTGGSASFASLTSPAQTVDAGSDCCAGQVTVGLARSPGGCPGKITSAWLGCCGCTGGKTPPTSLLLTVGPSTWDGTQVDAGCDACPHSICEGWGGSYVLDFIQMIFPSGCANNCQCGYCFYQYGPVPYAQVCNFLGNPGPADTNLTFQVQIDFDGHIKVFCVTDPPGGVCQYGPASQFVGQLNGPLADCENFNVTVPITKVNICNVPATVQVQTI